MNRATSILILLTAAGVGRADELEDILVEKFRTRTIVDSAAARKVVIDAVGRAAELKEADPERGLEILRAATNQVDAVQSLTPADRRAMTELVQPVLAELRDVALQKRRVQASMRIDAFKRYLEISGYEGRYPGRANPEKWEPAAFMAPDGTTRMGKLYAMGTGLITFKYGREERNQSPGTLPVIQVFSGLYVFDKLTGYHVFLTNREFYDFVWMPILRDYRREQFEQKAKRVPVGADDSPLLNASVASGEYFLRDLPNLPAIPGIGEDVPAFLEHFAQVLVQKGIPISVERIYDLDLQERLAGSDKIKLSAIRRVVHLLKLKNASVSPLYAEIMREETTQLLTSEYAGFTQPELNRAILYIFSKLD